MRSVLLCRVRCVAEVRLDRVVSREEVVSFFIADRRYNDAVVSGVPVGGCCELPLGRQLKRVDDSEYLAEVATRRGGVGQSKFNFLVWAYELSWSYISYLDKI